MKTTRRGFWAILSGMIGVAAMPKPAAVATPELPSIFIPTVWSYPGDQTFALPSTITVSGNVTCVSNNVWYTQPNTQWSFTQ